MSLAPTNRQILERLLATGQMELNRGSLFHTPPPPLPADLNGDRIEGMLLGLAVGDSLGIATEGRKGFEQRYKRYHCDLKDYIGDLGYPSDDTQMSFWLLESLLEEGEFVPEKVARLFLERGDEIHGIGRVVRDFCQRARQGGNWETWAPPPPALGNGALMRLAPIVLPHLKTPSANLWVDAALAARLTHDGSASTASGVALVGLLWQCLGLAEVPEPKWWVEEFVRLAAPLECRTSRIERGLWEGQESTVAGFVAGNLLRAWAEDWTVRRACSPQGEEEINPWGEKGWSSSGYILETVPSVLYILMRHGHDFEEAVLQAVNFTRDNDTIASIVGSVLGALHGKKAIPPRWLAGLSGRTRRPWPPSDDGQVQRLIARARRLWG